MAEKYKNKGKQTMATTIQLKRLTSTTLDLCNVVLKVGEPLLGKTADGAEYIVFGDGVKAVKDLAWEPIGDAAKAVDTDGITIIGTGLGSDELEVQISAESDNILSVESDGLYVPATDPAVFDDETIDGDGTADNPYTIKISAHNDNGLVIESDGIYVDQLHDVDGGSI